MLIASLCLQRYNILFSLSSNFFLNLLDLMMHFGYTKSKLHAYPCCFSRTVFYGTWYFQIESLQREL